MSIRTKRHSVSSSLASLRVLCVCATFLLAFAGTSVYAQSVPPSLTIQWPSGSVGRGSITLTVGGYSSTIRYGEFSTAASIAANFGGLISQDPHAPVWVKGYKDGTVRMKARSGSISGTPTICITPDGSSGCQQPGGTSIATGGVDPAGVYLGDAVYGYVIQKTDGSSGYDQAGNITAYMDTVNGQWAAGYDTMNRLTSAYQALTSPQLSAGQYIAAPWGSAAQQYLCWQYDGWGNRKMQTSSSSPIADQANCTAAGGSSQSYTNISYDDANGTNHITNNLYEYDQAGNVTGDGKYTYQYDSDGRLCAVQLNVTGQLTAYLYDAEGQRVAKGSINPPANSDLDTYKASWCNFAVNNFVPATHDIFDANGAKLVTLDGNDNWQSTNIYANGELVATYDTAGTHYQFSDWLSTRRLQTDIYGNSQERCMGGAYGEVNCPLLGANPLHFAGKERDGESGLDDFGARYYNSYLGRFMSPDWDGKAVAVPYADLANPQTLNLYSYVRNSPLGSADLDGHDDYMDSDFLQGTERKTLLAGMKDQKTKVQSDAQQEGLLWRLAHAVGLVNTDAEKAQIAAEYQDMEAHPEKYVVMNGGVSPFGGIGATAGRAVELANAMGKTKNFVTIAVTATEEGTTVVSSSENALRPSVQALLKDGEVAAKGAGHAEVTGVNAARSMGLSPTGVAASRAICPSCAQFLQNLGIKALSFLK